MALGERLRKRREALKMSQQKLSERARTRQATISDIERGTLKNPGIMLVRRLARVLGVTSDWLIGMYDDEEVEEDAPAVVLLGEAVPGRGRGGLCAAFSSPYGTVPLDITADRRLSRPSPSSGQPQTIFWTI